MDFYLPTGEIADAPYDLGHELPPDDDGYTSEPTHLRIYREDNGDEWPWRIDGVDATGRYTEAVERYATEAEALAARECFVADYFTREEQ